MARKKGSKLEISSGRYIRISSRGEILVEIVIGDLGTKPITVVSRRDIRNVSQSFKDTRVGLKLMEKFLKDQLDWHLAMGHYDEIYVPRRAIRLAA